MSERIRSIILNNATLGSSSPGSTLGGAVDLFPTFDLSGISKLTFIMTVHGVTGNPTSGVLSTKFQLGNPHTGVGYEFTTPRLQDLTAVQKSTLITEGIDWPDIPYNSTFPVTVTRTIKDYGAMCNLRLDASTLSGGTTPKFTISLTLVQEAE